MRDRSLLGLGGAALAVALLAFLLPAPDSDRHPQAAVATPVLPGLGGWIGNASRILIVGAGQGLAFTRDPATVGLPGDAVPATGWRLAAKGGYPVQPAAMRSLLQGLLDLREVAAKTTDPALYPRLGVEGPKPDGASGSRLVLIADAAGHSVSLILGHPRYAAMSEDPATEGDGVYLRVPGMPQSWLARPALEASNDPLFWIDPTILDIDPSRIASVSVAGGKDPAFVLQRAHPGDPFALSGLAPGMKLKDPDPTAAIPPDFTALTLIDVAPASRLPAPPRSTIRMRCFDGLGLDLAVTGLPDGSSWLTVAAAGTGKAADEARTINARAAGWAYELPAGRAGPLELTIADISDVPAPAPTKSGVPTRHRPGKR